MKSLFKAVVIVSSLFTVPAMATPWSITTPGVLATTAIGSKATLQLETVKDTTNEGGNLIFFYYPTTQVGNCEADDQLPHKLQLEDTQIEMKQLCLLKDNKIRIAYTPNTETDAVKLIESMLESPAIKLDQQEFETGNFAEMVDKFIS